MTRLLTWLAWAGFTGTTPRIRAGHRASRERAPRPPCRLVPAAAPYHSPIRLNGQISQILEFWHDYKIIINDRWRHAHSLAESLTTGTEGDYGKGSARTRSDEWMLY